MREIRKITTQTISIGPFNLEDPIVQQVLDIAERILSENRALDAKLLYYEARRRLGIDRKILLAIIKSLLEKKILVEGSKLTREIVLSNVHRKNIYNFIKTHVGSNFSMIREAYKGTTGSSGQLIWHLQMLLKFDYVKKVKFKKYTILLPIEIGEEMGIYHFLLRDELNKNIINLLIEEETIRKSDIHRFLDESREKIYYRINNLIDSKIVVIKEGSKNDICINIDSKDIIIRILKSQGG